MDIALRFWSNTKNEVVTRYYDSAFLGHATAADLQKCLFQKLESVNFKKMLQLSLDGPYVNLKMSRDLEAYLKSVNDPNDPIFLFIGTCGLHVVNNAFKCGFNDKIYNWSVITFLRAFFLLFKDVRARRSDLAYYSRSSLMPLKFCFIRWLNNCPVATRAKELLPNLIKFVNGVEGGVKGNNNDSKTHEIKSYSYSVVKRGVKDKLMPLKLQFFIAIAAELEPFLTEFQSDAPLAPFLYVELTSILRNLIVMFVKKDVLTKNTSLVRIDVTAQKNLLASKDVNLPFSVKAEMRKTELKSVEILSFKTDCVQILQAICVKLQEKSPLNYKLCKAISFCDPTLLKDPNNPCISRLETTLTIFVEKNWISANQGTIILKEFKALSSKPEVILSCKAYNRKKERLDHFWRGICISYDCSDLLWGFLKKVLVLSQGNAFVERGFSINGEIVVENQLNESLIAQRQVYDGLKSAGGLTEMKTIPKAMIHSVRNSRAKYEESMKQKRREKTDKAVDDVNKLRLTEELRNLKQKKLMVLTERAKEMEEIDKPLQDLCGSSVV